jgi:transposase
MFDKSQAGVKASANLYSLIETAKANNVNPHHYLKHVFSRLPNMTTKDDINELMPWQFENS